MAKVICRDYGYDCDFFIEGDMDKVVQEFGRHIKDKHGIEYQPETLTKFLMNK